MSEPARFAAEFDRVLAAHQVHAGTRRAAAFGQLLVAFPPHTHEDAYWLARIAMLPSIDDLAAFDAAFLLYWSAGREALGRLLEPLPRPSTADDSTRPRRPQPPPPSGDPATNQRLEQAPMMLAMASPDERLQERDFATLTDDERGRLLGLIARLRSAVETRPSRRRTPAARGDRFDLRATLRIAPRTAGELVRRRASIRRKRLRPLVFLCDISGSMAPYARAMLLYARGHAIARRRVRAFAFATRLTDLTKLLQQTSADRLMAALGVQLRDYGGGTRIGCAIGAFNQRWAQRGAARGGTVIILSDGWERDDPELLRAEMQRLRRLARRIIWVNPQKKHPAFAPLTAGMAAALPFVDQLLAGYSLRTLDAIADAIDGGRRRRAERLHR